MHNSRSTSQSFTTRDGRRFAFSVGIVLLLIAGIAAHKDHRSIGIVLATLAALLITGGAVMPARLGPIHRAWMRMALLISKVTTPVILSILWFLVITPFSLLARSLRRHSITATGWIRREAAGRSDLRRHFCRAMWSVLKELFAYAKEHKKLILLPLIIVLVLVGGLLFIAQGSALAPFIYTLF